MRPFFPPRPHPNPNQAHPHQPDPNPSPLPMLPLNPAFPPPLPPIRNFAANPMALPNPLIALQLLGQAQQLQNLGFLAAAAALQQQPQFLPGGFVPNSNQFAALGDAHMALNGGGGFRTSGVRVPGPRPILGAVANGPSGRGAGGVGAGGPRPILGAAAKGPNGGGAGGVGAGGPGPMLGAAVNGLNGRGAGGVGAGGPRPMLGAAAKGPNGRGAGSVGAGGPPPMMNGAVKDLSSGGSGGVIKPTENRVDGRSRFSYQNGGRNYIRDQKGRFNPGRHGKDGRPFGRPGGRGKARPFNQGRGRGSYNWREEQSNVTSSESPASSGRRRRAPIIYDIKEVKQWREARKKNYPTSVNIKKKLTQSSSNGQHKDEEAQMRRQQLKEVLAKQQELGFELPEILPGYLSENEGQANQRNSKWKTHHSGGHFRSHFNIKRARYDCTGFRSKRPKLQNNTPGGDDGAMTDSREPTLLQKLLSADIKRDKYRLLHTFKFMALNNFFEDWPEKALEFPTVKVNQIELDSNISMEDLDGMQNADTKGSSIVVEEIGDQKDSSSTDEENESSDDDNDDGGDDNNDSASTESSYEAGNDDDNAEQSTGSENISESNNE